MRLTYWNDRKGHFDWHCENNEIADKLAAYEDTGLSPEEIKLNMDGLDEYHKAEAEGRLVILPCKVGDMVFKPFLRPLSVVPMVVLRIILDGIDNQIIVDGGRSVCFCDIGKTVFLTREEAEAALKGETEDV